MKDRGYKRWLIILTHAAAWVLLFSLPYLLRPSYDDGDHKPGRPETTNLSFIASGISDVLLVSFFYLNAGLLMGKLFYKKKFSLYIITVLLCFAGFTLLSYLVTTQFSVTDHNFTLRRHILFSTFVFLFILACSIAYKTIKDRFTADKLTRERENENLKTELSLLRSQVSPHFMFNVLNNMVALARKQSDLLEPSLIKLSALMRYMLYETGEHKVSLEKETEYLQSYIDLQKMRFSSRLAVNTMINMTGGRYDIEPMLLIPFVENAFKHGTGVIDNPQIDISLNAENNTLYFTVKNKYNPLSKEIKDGASGIGLANVRRRLELLYPGRHSLEITRENNTFNISLQLDVT